MIKKLCALVFFALCFDARMAVATSPLVSPLSVNIVPPIQFPPADFNITGLRASVFWGRHQNVTGLDLGLIGNMSEQGFVGTSIAGLFNFNQGPSSILGLQFAGLTNINNQRTEIYGAQLALGANYNQSASSIYGLELAGLANVAPYTDIVGAQIGIYNRARSVYGLQIGLVNVATALYGIQIGLMNINDKGPFTMTPILNIGY